LEEQRQARLILVDGYLVPPQHILGQDPSIIVRIHAKSEVLQQHYLGLQHFIHLNAAVSGHPLGVDDFLLVNFGSEDDEAQRSA